MSHMRDNADHSQFAFSVSIQLLKLDAWKKVFEDADAPLTTWEQFEGLLHEYVRESGHADEPISPDDFKEFIEAVTGY